MRFPRSLSACLVFVTSTTLAFGQSDDAVNEPQLGPIIVLGVDTSDPGAPRLLPAEAELGPIVPIAAYVEEDTNARVQLVSGEVESHLPSSLPFGIETIRIIGKPTAAPIDEPITTDVTSITVAVNPEQIRFHLTEAAKHLKSAGLSDEAQKIHDIQQQIQREHHQRLLTVYLKSTFAAVEAEIALLKASIPLFGCKFPDVSHEPKPASDK